MNLRLCLKATHRNTAYKNKSQKAEERPLLSSLSASMFAGNNKYLDTCEKMW